MRILQSCFISLLLLTALSSCFDTGGSEGNSLVNIYLIDAPGDFDEAWIEIDRVEIMTGDAEGNPSGNWIPMDYIPERHTVNVSNLVGGTRLVLGRTEVPIGKITRIKLLLRENHYLVKDEERMDLPLADTVSAEIIVEADFDLESTISYDILLDFDLDGSIKPTGASEASFVLVPKVRAFSTVLHAAIGGSISPANARPVVYAIKDQDTLSTRTSPQGEFVFQGLAAGDYNILVQPLPPYLDSLVTAVPAQTGLMTQIETIILENPEEEEEETPEETEPEE